MSAVSSFNVKALGQKSNWQIVIFLLAVFFPVKLILSCQ